MSQISAPPPDDGTCDCCGCDPETHGVSLLGLALCVAAIAVAIGLALIVRGAVKDPDTAAHGEPR